MTTYYCTEKRGTKRVGLAVWIPSEGGEQTCLAQAAHVFEGHGITGETDRQNVTQYKNWSGMVTDAPVFRDSERDASEHGEKSHARDYIAMGCDWNEFRADQEPEFITELEYAAI